MSYTKKQTQIYLVETTDLNSLLIGLQPKTGPISRIKGELQLQRLEYCQQKLNNFRPQPTPLRTQNSPSFSKHCSFLQTNRTHNQLMLNKIEAIEIIPTVIRTFQSFHQIFLDKALYNRIPKAIIISKIQTFNNIGLRTVNLDLIQIKEPVTWITTIFTLIFLFILFHSYLPLTLVLSLWEPFPHRFQQEKIFPYLMPPELFVLQRQNIRLKSENSW